MTTLSFDEVFTTIRREVAEAHRKPLKAPEDFHACHAILEKHALLRSVRSMLSSGPALMGTASEVETTVSDRSGHLAVPLTSLLLP